MPFAVVQTVSANGKKEISVVPEGWLLDATKSNTTLLWPSAKNGPSINKMLKDGDSVASTSWNKMLCVVKRRHIGSSFLADEIAEGMSGESSSQVENVKEKTKIKKRWAKPNIETYQNLLIDKENYEPVFASGFSSKNEEAYETEVLPRILIENETTFIEEDMDNTSNVVPLQMLECVNCKRIEKEVQEIKTQNEQNAKKIDTILASMQILLDYIGPKRNEQRRLDAEEQMNFVPLEDSVQLELFDDNLNNAEYQEKILSYLKSNITEARSENRMTEAIDLLFSKKLFAEISWTGIGKTGPKIAMMRHTRVTKLFEIVGTTDLVSVNRASVAEFFMKKLKNAPKRLLAKGLRKSTSHFIRAPKLE